MSIKTFEASEMSCFLWLRTQVVRKVLMINGQHQGVSAPVLSNRIALDQQQHHPPSAVLLAAELVGSIKRSRSLRGVALRRWAQRILDGMSELEREILVLRHLEELSNADTAGVLSISESEASRRYVAALRHFSQRTSWHLAESSRVRSVPSRSDESA